MGSLLAGLIFVTGYVLTGPTASGVWTHPGTAACPHNVPFGTRLNIDGIGPVVCEDRYPYGMFDHVDVWVNSVPMAEYITGMHAVSFAP